MCSVKIKVIKKFSEDFGLFEVYDEYVYDDGKKIKKNWRIENFLVEAPDSPYKTKDK